MLKLRGSKKAKGNPQQNSGWLGPASCVQAIHVKDKILTTPSKDTVKSLSVFVEKHLGHLVLYAPKILVLGRHQNLPTTDQDNCCPPGCRAQAVGTDMHGITLQRSRPPQYLSAVLQTPIFLRHGLCAWHHTKDINEPFLRWGRSSHGHRSMALWHAPASPYQQSGGFS